MARINEIKLANIVKVKGKDGNLLYSGDIKNNDSIIGTFSESAWDMPPEVEISEKGMKNRLGHLSKCYFKKYPPVYLEITNVEAMISDLLVFGVIQNRMESVPGKGALVVFTGKSVELFLVEKDIAQREVELLVIAQTDNPKTKVRYFLFLSDDDFDIAV